MPLSVSLSVIALRGGGRAGLSGELCPLQRLQVRLVDVARHIMAVEAGALEYLNTIAVVLRKGQALKLNA